MVLFSAPPSAMEKMKTMSKEDMQEEMGKWMTWGEENKSNLADMGSGLGPSNLMSNQGNSIDRDDFICYSIIQAQSMDGALEVLKDHPHLKWHKDATMRVYQIMEHSS